MIPRLITWMVLTALGVVIVSLPDSGPRLLTLSSEHGPSASDGVGILLILTAFASLLIPIARNRDRVAHQLKNRFGLSVGLGFLIGLGTGLVIASVFMDFWWWWLVGAILSKLAWLWLWVLAVKVDETITQSGDR